MSSFVEKYAAEKVAKRVFSVKAVANELEVRLPGDCRVTDEDIASAAASTLKWNILVPHDKIKVTVSKGWITLEGEVKWQFQKKAAEHPVRNLTGVTGVSNLITVRPRVSPTELKSRIEEALRHGARHRRPPHHRPGGRWHGDPARERPLVCREGGSRTGGLVGSGYRERREPHHRGAVASF